MLLRFCCTLLFVCSMQVSVSPAQMISRQAGADSVSNALVPAFGYSSSEGFIGGVVYNRYDYRGNARPFNNYLESSALISTKGFIKFEAKYEQMKSFGRNIRSMADIYFHRYPLDVFFGIGNNTTYSESRWENGYYYYKSISSGLSYQLRIPVYNDTDSQLDIQAGFGTEYHIPYIKKQESSFARFLPNGHRGGWVNSLNTGLTWENRNSEFDPTEGNRAELELRFAPGLISSYALATARLELRQYFQLFNWLTVANRVEARHGEGDLPYWEMPTLGDSHTLRGYPLNRFKGNSSLAYTLELRGWFFAFPDLYNLKLGGHLFTDTGRVFTDQDTIDDLLHGYKQTFGLGGAMSIFNKDFILRGEIGFSKKVSRVYIGVGYLF